MTDAIITDNERINIEPKDVMVKGSNKKQVDWPPESPDNQYHLNK